MSVQSFSVKLPLPTQAATEADATLVAWKVESGSSFSKGTILAEAESAKASFSLEAPCDGKVIHLLHKPGDVVTFEEPVIEIETCDPAMRSGIAAPQPANCDSPAMVVNCPAATTASHGTMMEEPIGIIGLGGALPDRIVTTGELLTRFPDLTEEYMLGVTGIRERRWAAADELPSDLALKAAQQALAKAGLQPADLDAIVLTTTTPDVVMPATACILQEKLGTRGIPAFDLNAACSGWLYGLVVARGLILAGVGERILVVGVDLQSRLVDKNDKGTYFLFGDGAGAAIVARNAQGHQIVEHIITADAKGINMARRQAPGYTVTTDFSTVDPWIRLDGYALFRFATESFSLMIRNVVEKSGWQPDSVRWVVPHQANGRIIQAAAKKSGIPFSRFYLNIDRVGNTSSASIPLALLEIENGLQKGDRVVFCSVGAGITAGAVSLVW